MNGKSVPAGQVTMKKLWISFATVFSLSFAVLGWSGTCIYQQMPPIPRSVVSADGTVLLAEGNIAKRSERLAGVGRDGSGVGVGAWQLRRTRLDGRLVASGNLVRVAAMGFSGIQCTLQCAVR